MPEYYERIGLPMALETIEVSSVFSAFTHAIQVYASYVLLSAKYMIGVSYHKICIYGEDSAVVAETPMPMSRLLISFIFKSISVFVYTACDGGIGTYFLAQ